MIYIEFKTKLWDLIINDNGDTVKAFNTLKAVKPEHMSPAMKSKCIGRDLEKQIGNSAYREVIGNYTEFLRVDKLPHGVSVNGNGFLVSVRVDTSQTRWMKR